VKAWLQLTMADKRFPGVYITSVHHEKMSKDKPGFF